MPSPRLRPPCSPPSSGRRVRSPSRRRATRSSRSSTRCDSRSGVEDVHRRDRRATATTRVGRPDDGDLVARVLRPAELRRPREQRRRDRARRHGARGHQADAEPLDGGDRRTAVVHGDLHVAAPRGSNLSNGVTETSAVIIGPATYITLVEHAHRPAEVRLELPAGWKGSMTSLDASSDGRPNHYVAPDYDILADSPILAGVDLSTTEFTVGGITHYWTYLGQAEWDGAKVAGRADAAHRGARPLLGRRCRSGSTRSSTSSRAAAAGRASSTSNSVAITGGGREPADAGGAIPERRVHQPRVLPRDERQAPAPGRARAVRLRARAGDDRAVGRRGADVVLRRSARRAVGPRHRRRTI